MIDLLSRSTMSECPLNISCDGRIFVTLGALAVSVQEVVRVCGFHVDVGVEGFLVLPYQDVRHPPSAGGSVKAAESMQGIISSNY